MTINYQIYFDIAKNPATRMRKKTKRTQKRQEEFEQNSISDRKFQFSGLFQRPVLNCLDVHPCDVYVTRNQSIDRNPAEMHF